MKWNEPKMVCFWFCLKGNMLLIEVDCNWLGWDWDITTTIIRSYDEMISTSLHLLPSMVIWAALSVTAESYMVLLHAISSCWLCQLSSLAQDHHCQLLLCSPMLLWKSCSSVFVYYSWKLHQDCDVTSKAAVFILMSSSQPLTGGLAECWVIT